MLAFLNDILWGKVLIALLIIIGLGFTVASRFVQFRYFGRMFRILSASQAFKHDKHGHLSSFQALLLSVAGRVGGGQHRRGCRGDHPGEGPEPCSGCGWWA